MASVGFVSGVTVRGRALVGRSVSNVRHDLLLRRASRTVLRMATNEENVVKAASAKGPAPAPADEDSYVKLAMRNMVRQGGKAILHFSMTAGVMLVFFTGLAFLMK